MQKRQRDIDRDLVKARARMLDNHCARKLAEVIAKKRALEATLESFGLRTNNPVEAMVK
jgi:hypothetical protein